MLQLITSGASKVLSFKENSAQILIRYMTTKAFKQVEIKIYSEGTNWEVIDHSFQVKGLGPQHSLDSTQYEAHKRGGVVII